MPLGDNEAIVLGVFCGDIPGLPIAFLAAPDAKALALANGVEGQTAVFTQGTAFDGFNGSGLSRNIAVQKLGERPFADKADTGTVFFPVDIDSCFPGQLPDLDFAQLSKWENCPAQLFLT